VTLRRPFALSPLPVADLIGDEAGESVKRALEMDARAKARARGVHQRSRI